MARKVSRKLETTVTFLEMTAPAAQHVPAPANLKLALMLAEAPPVHFYRYLYDTIGRAQHWIDRARMSDTDLAAAITAEETEIFVAYANGVPAGFFELDWRDGREMWLAYFGIMPEFRGRGLGKWLLSEAIAAAWLKRAKQAYKLLGKTDEWKKYLGETKEKYKRRPALQKQLARL